jgi:hypothetical protein
MPRLPVLSPSEVIRLLSAMGFEEVRQIIRDTGVTPEAFLSAR